MLFIRKSCSGKKAKEKNSIYYFKKEFSNDKPTNGINGAKGYDT